MASQSKTPDPNSPEQPEMASVSTRQRILAAALKLFVEQGYFNTNVPDLSRLSKCSVGSIYHTFTNKEEIAASLYNESIAAFRHALGESISGTEDVGTVVKQIVKSFLEFSELNFQLSKYIWLCRHIEFLGGITRHPTTVGYDKLGRMLTKTIKKGMRQGLIRELPAQILWSIIFGIPLAYVRDWLDGFNKAPPSEVADLLAEAAWRALQK